MKVGDLDDKRWPTALDALDAGEPIQLGELVTITYPSGSGPRIDILADGDPRFTPRTRAEREIREGVALVWAAAEQHPRLGEILRRDDAVWQYIFDYGQGAVVLARIDGDNLTWVE